MNTLQVKGERLPESPVSDDFPLIVIPPSNQPKPPSIEDSYLSCTELSPEYIKIKHNFAEFVCLVERKESCVDPFDFWNIERLANWIVQYIIARIMNFQLLYKDDRRGSADRRPYCDTVQTWVSQLHYIIDIQILRYYHPMSSARNMDEKGLKDYERVSHMVFDGGSSLTKGNQGLSFILARHLCSIYRMFGLRWSYEKRLEKSECYFNECEPKEKSPRMN